MTDPKTEGVLETISKLEEIPKRLAEAILEGMSKEPQEFIILGLGFFIGYEGYDVLDPFLKGIHAKMKSPADAATIALLGPLSLALPKQAIDIAKVAVFPWFGALEAFWNANIDLSQVPFKQKQRTDEEIRTDPNKSDGQKAVEIWAHDQKARILLGAMGAIAAYAITRPGFFAGIGEIVKGIGETVPG